MKTYVLLKRGSHNGALLANTYEESIILYDMPDHLKTKRDIFNHFVEQFSVEPYENEDGDLVEWKVVAVVDEYEPDAPIEAPNATELYSRHLSFKFRVSTEHVLDTFYLDYVWLHEGTIDDD
ncbi:hypothetical protein GOP80_05740 [Planococcaceae bacterium Storch 2/2-2]|nr:hypothetical protein [Planococcaceae bacterium Storch 2/2-2]